MKSFHAAFVSAIALFLLAPIALAPSAMAQSTCTITEVRPDAISHCEELWGTYSRAFVVTYSGNPTSGHLSLFGTGDGVFVSATAPITGSPQTVMLNGLPVNGLEVTVTASFSAAPECSREVTYTAPTSCDDVGGSDCWITSLEALDQTECDPETNTYMQYVKVTYENPVGDVLIVNGQSFAVTSSPQTVKLTGLPADGNPVDVTAYFQAEPECEKSVYGLFRALEDCQTGGACAINNLEALGQTDCDPATNTYTQDIRVTYENPVGDVLVVNGQSFTVTGSPQTVTLTDLTADGQLVDVFAYFEDDPDCEARRYGLFRAPSKCDASACAITALEALDQSECDPATNTYSQYIRVTYESPAGAVLVVNGQSFDITSSPQTVKLTGLEADGQLVNVTAFFQSERTCTTTVRGLFRAPDPCGTNGECRITDIRFGTIMDCLEDTNKYSVTIFVLYENEPDTGMLSVVGFDGFPAVSISVPITGSPQQVTLNGLPANGQLVSIQASFSADTFCSLTKKDLYQAPMFCEPFDCMITAIIDDNNTICDPRTNTYSQQVIVEYVFPPTVGTLDVNGQSFPIEGSPQTIVLEDLPADGQPVDVTARFSAEPGCVGTESALFVAPPGCEEECSLDITKGEQTACDPETNTYTQALTVSYTSPPQTGQLALVVGLDVQLFDFDPAAGSVDVVFTGLVADGQPVDVTAFFTDEATCEVTKYKLFTAPKPCDNGGDECDIDLSTREVECDEEAETYTQELIVTFTNAPTTGTLDVRFFAMGFGERTASIDMSASTTSPQVFEFTALPLDGLPVGACASFSDDPECEECDYHLYVAPEECDDNGGDHTLDFVFLGDEEIRVDAPDESEGDIHCNNDIRFITTNGSRGFHTGDLIAVDDITVKGRNVVDGSAIAGDDLTIDNHAEVTGDKLDDQDVDEIEIPDVEEIEAGEQEIHIGDGLTRTVQPGDYDEITVGEGGKLILRSGEYNLEELVMDEAAVLSLEITNEEPVVINVDSRLQLDDEVRMEMTPETVTTLVQFNYADDDRDVIFGEGSIIFGTILAPEAVVRLEDEAFFKGAICAERIYVESEVKFAPHDSDMPVPEFAETANSNPTDTAVGAPRGFQLSASPNPFNPNTRIHYSIPQAGDVSLVVYTATGRKVRRLVRSPMTEGTYTVVWNGRDDRGTEVPSGRYYAVLRSRGIIKKSLGIVLLR